MMHHGATRIALLAYVLGGLLLPMTHRHAAPADVAAAASGHHHSHSHHGHCHGASGCGDAESAERASASASIAAAATDRGPSHHCHGSCALCLAAGQVVTLDQPIAGESGPLPPVVVPTPDVVSAPAVRVSRANRLRGPPALLS